MSRESGPSSVRFSPSTYSAEGFQLTIKACATSPSQRGWKTLKVSSGACVGRTWTTCPPIGAVADLLGLSEPEMLRLAMAYHFERTI